MRGDRIARPSACRLAVLVLGLGSLTTACQWAFHGESFVSAREESPVTFSHKRHSEADIDCLVCHERIDESKATTGSNLPGTKICLKCHDAAYVAKNAVELEKLQPRRGGLKFSHEGHLPEVKDDCLVCHGSVLKSTAYGRHPSPGMDTCTRCHQAQMAENRCTACHAQERLVSIRPVRFLSHEGDWVRRHPGNARGGGACHACHGQSFCADCHNRFDTLKPSLRDSRGVARQLIHRDDFVARHFIEAKGNAAQCLTCHSVSRCDSCHVQQGVSFAGAVSARQGLPRGPHPESFMDRTAPEFHGRAMRRDVVGCASCHDQGPATNCISCHKSGRMGGNPHPVGFTSSQDRKATPMCRWCHEGR